jgi:tetratricopeptide (TPR) repeat protein
MLNIKNICLLAALAILTVSCSSAPKDTGDIRNLQKSAEKELKNANDLIRRGNLDTAYLILGGCKQKAVLADNWPLIIRSSLALGNVMLSIDDKKEKAIEELEEAERLAVKNGNRELLAVSRIFLARARLLSGNISTDEVIKTVDTESVNITADQLYKAFAYQVKGLALLRNGKYNEAAAEIEKSRVIHNNLKYLENEAYDWYVIASARSLGKDKDGAIKALILARDIDRRIENSWGLAADYRALGDVYKRYEDNSEAKAAYERAVAIYSALNNDKEVAAIWRIVGDIYKAEGNESEAEKAYKTANDMTKEKK